MLETIGAAMAITAAGGLARCAWRHLHSHEPTLWDLYKHVYVPGTTGAGKTNLLKLLAKRVMDAGHGLFWLCPEGTAAELLAVVPPDRVNDVIVINPSDRRRVTGFDFLGSTSAQERFTLVDDAIAAFRREFVRSTGDRIIDIQRHALLAVAEARVANPELTGAGLIEVYRCLSDPVFRETRVLPFCQSPLVVDFFVRQYDDNDRSTQSALRQIRATLYSDQLLFTLSQSQGIDFYEAMATRKIVLFLVNELSEETQRLLLSLALTKIKQALLRRKPWEPPIFIFMDEFQEFAALNTGLAQMLARARKRKAILVLANQGAHQFSNREIAQAVWLAGTWLMFRPLPTDANSYVRQLAPHYDYSQVIQLPNYQAIIRPLVANVPRRPFVWRVPLCPAGFGKHWARAVYSAANEAHGMAVPALRQLIEQRFAGGEPADFGGVMPA